MNNLCPRGTYVRNEEVIWAAPWQNFETMGIELPQEPAEKNGIVAQPRTPRHQGTEVCD